jgi:hypothetical protein
MKTFMAEVEEVTPAMAAKWLVASEESKEVCHRMSSIKHVMRYAEAIRKGDWVDGEGSALIIGPKGEIIDGLHRLKAVVVAGESIRAKVTRIDSVDDAADALEAKHE